MALLKAFSSIRYECIDNRPEAFLDARTGGPLQFVVFKLTVGAGAARQNVVNTFDLLFAAERLGILGDQ